MDVAYARFHANQNWSREDFWSQLNDDERFAVFLGDMSAQVLNGGFVQWWSNRYATDETFAYIIRTCEKINTEATRDMAVLVKRARTAIDGRAERDLDEDAYDKLNDKLDKLDAAFYAINTQFLTDAEAYLAAKEAHALDH